MDRFFIQTYCDRCHKELKDGRTMSMFNEDCICMECARAEIKEEGYKQARDADHEEIRKENYTYKGIGRKKTGK